MLAPRPSKQQSRVNLPHLSRHSLRHAAASAPWPWIDTEDLPYALEQLEANRVDTDNDQDGPIIPCRHKDCQDCFVWNRYPKPLFPGWTPSALRKAKIKDAIRNSGICTIYFSRISSSGAFGAHGTFGVSQHNVREAWNDVINKKWPPDTRVEAFFLENLSGPILQMLGTRFNIEPSFYSASLNWTPSSQQRYAMHKSGDHITIILTFLCAMTTSPTSLEDGSRLRSLSKSNVVEYIIGKLHSWGHTAKNIIRNRAINSQSRFPMQRVGEKLFAFDLLALHMVRSSDGDTIISYHPNTEWHPFSAKELHTRFRLVESSVHWQTIFRKTQDSTLAILVILWHVVYAWDEALEILHARVSELESSAIDTNDTKITQELHHIRAVFLKSASYLTDFKNSVLFVRDTPNPRMDADDIPPAQIEYDRLCLKSECNEILGEIERLEMLRASQDAPLTNTMNFVFTNATITDSKAMKRLSLLTMIFLPASFVATVFGMSVKEFDPGLHSLPPLATYVKISVGLTLFTTWLLVALQSDVSFGSGMMRLLWPIALLWHQFSRTYGEGNGQ